MDFSGYLQKAKSRQIKVSHIPSHRRSVINTTLNDCVHETLTSTKFNLIHDWDIILPLDTLLQEKRMDQMMKALISSPAFVLESAQLHDSVFFLLLQYYMALMVIMNP